MGREYPDSFGEALVLARRILSSDSRLVELGLVDPEAEQLVIAAVRKAQGKSLSRMELFSSLQNRFPEAAGKSLLLMAGARAEGRPLQYVTGYQQFLEHEYEVTPAVLIPRPETEFLVSAAFGMIDGSSAGPLMGLEIGLGSGVISIELLGRFSRLRMLASELAPGAREVAQRNAERILGGEAARLAVLPAKGPGEVFEPFSACGPGQADFIISNPPYLMAADAIEPDVILHEPKAALFAPEGDPLYFYRKVAEEGRRFLRSSGFVLMEMPHERAPAILELFTGSGWDAQVLPDLTDRPRVLVAEWGEENG